MSGRLVGISRTEQAQYCSAFFRRFNPWLIEGEVNDVVGLSWYRLSSRPESPDRPSTKRCGSVYLYLKPWPLLETGVSTFAGTSLRRRGLLLFHLKRDIVLVITVSMLVVVLPSQQHQITKCASHHVLVFVTCFKNVGRVQHQCRTFISSLGLFWRRGSPPLLGPAWGEEGFSCFTWRGI